MRKAIYTMLVVSGAILLGLLFRQNALTPMTSKEGISVSLVAGPDAELGELIQQQKARDESIRRISYQGMVRQYVGLDVQRTDTESIDQFISRVASLMPEYDQVPPYPLSGCRDFGTGVYQFTMGDINADIPKYMNWFVDVGWKATFNYMQPMESPPGAKQVIWYRIYWEEIDGELVIVRVDQLSVVGDENTTPIGVILLDDHRLVDGRQVPFRVRYFRLGKVVKGIELTITDLKLNDSVDVPERMVIPEGSPVRNFISGKLYRQPADKITIDR